MSKFTIARPVHNVSHGLHLFRNRKTLWHMIREVVRGDYKMSFVTTLIAVVAIAYALFPFDFIPDFIPVLGWLDDGLILYLLLKQLVKETHRYNRHKAMERKGL